MTDEKKEVKPEDETATPPAPPALDTLNRFLVSTDGQGKTVLMTIGGMRAYTKLEMLSLVAWVIVMAELDEEEIAKAVEAVKSC